MVGRNIWFYKCIYVPFTLSLNNIVGKDADDLP